MRGGPLLVATTTLIAISCSGSSGPAAGASPSPSPTAMASGTPAVSPIPVTPGSSYGLYLVGTRLDMIATNGQVGASAPVAAPSVRRCSVALGAVLQPPVSASSTKVYFRDGDTRCWRSCPLAPTQAERYSCRRGSGTFPVPPRGCGWPRSTPVTHASSASGRRRRELPAPTAQRPTCTTGPGKLLVRSLPAAKTCIPAAPRPVEASSSRTRQASVLCRPTCCVTTVTRRV